MIPMPKFGFNYYALHYLNLWTSQDQPCCDALAGRDREKKLKALAKAAADYGIARTLPKQDGADKGPERYGPVLSIIDRQKRDDFRHNELPQRIERVNRQIVRQYKSDHQLLSLTTKFLWLKIRTPIIIYDSRARNALRVTPGNIVEYYSQWRKEFGRCDKRIRDACACLPKVYEYMKPSEKTTRDDVAKIAAQQWFRERVFDVYLWDIGLGSRSTD